MEEVPAHIMGAETPSLPHTGALGLYSVGVLVTCQINTNVPFRPYLNYP